MCVKLHLQDQYNLQLCRERDISIVSIVASFMQLAKMRRERRNIWMGERGRRRGKIRGQDRKVVCKRGKENRAGKWFPVPKGVLKLGVCLQCAPGFTV